MGRASCLWTFPGSRRKREQLERRSLPTGQVVGRGPAGRTISDNPWRSMDKAGFCVQTSLHGWAAGTVCVIRWAIRPANDPRQTTAS